MRAARQHPPGFRLRVRGRATMRKAAIAGSALQSERQR